MTRTPRLIIQRRLIVEADRSKRILVRVRAKVAQPLEDLLLAHFADELLVQKPIVLGSLPFELHRDRSGLPVNTHLLRFLENPESIALTVATLLLGHTYAARSLWDAIAFEEFALSACARLEILCRHAGDFVPGPGGEASVASRPDHLIAAPPPSAT